jgi:hypothetical protein
MTLRRLVLPVFLMVLICCSWNGILGQRPKVFPGALPRVLLLVHQQMLPGKAAERERLEIDTARRFDELSVPITWLELEAVTGPPQALFFDPAESFGELDQAGAILANTFAAHPDLAQQQQQIEERLAGSRTVVATRSDELGFGAEKIDLAKARYLRITVVRLQPGRQRDFAEADHIRRNSLSNAHAESAWAVYEVEAGLPSPTFLMIETVRSLQDLDKAIGIQRKAESSFQDVERKRMDEITRDAYVSVESNLYAIHPDMSHVPKEFAAGDPTYWIRK